MNAMLAGRNSHASTRLWFAELSKLRILKSFMERIQSCVRFGIISELAENMKKQKWEKKILHEAFILKQTRSRVERRKVKILLDC